MCELLIQTVDRVDSTDPYLDSKLFKRGDVIVAFDDGHAWGVEEVVCAEWMIAKLPGVPLEVGQAMLGSEPETNPNAPSRMLQPRAFRLDLDRMPSDPSRMTVDDFLSLKVRKAPIQDPNIIG